MENSFDWENILSQLWQEADIRSMKGAVSLSDASRVSGCINLSAWSDIVISKFIQEFTNKKGINGKSEEQSSALRQKGNSFFQKELYSDALSCYTQSVMMAPDDCSPIPTNDASPCLATALGNRSAALYHLGHYELAMEDCQRAVNCGYLRTSLYKVLQRKGQCLLALGHPSQAREAFTEAILSLDEADGMDPKRKSLLKLDLEKLVHQTSQSSENLPPVITINQSVEETLTCPSDNLANASRSLDLQHSADRGRYLVAEVPVSAGELLIKEVPYAVLLLPEYHSTHCHQCCRKTINPIPCPDCIYVQYCSDQCLLTAQESHHWLECGHYNNLQTLGTEAWLSLRMLLKAKCWCSIGSVTQASTSTTSSNNWQQCGHVSSTEILAFSGMNSDMRDSTVHNVPHVHDGTPHLKGVTSNSDSSSNFSTTHLGRESLMVGSSSFGGGVNSVRMPKTGGYNEVPGVQYPTRGTCTSLQGCGRDGCYQSDYEAVYHLMPHTENHTPQELFNMTMTAILLSKCIKSQLQSVPQWRHSVECSTQCCTPHRTTDAASPQCSHKTKQDVVHHTQPESCENTMGVKSGIDQPLETQDVHFGCGSRFDSSLEQMDNSKNCCCSPVVAVLLLRHIQQLKCNAHAVTAIHTSANENPLNSRHSRSPTSNNFDSTALMGQRIKDDTPVDTRVDRQGGNSIDPVVDTTRQVRVATAVYPTASLLNHACEPNIIASFDGDVLSIRAIRNIEAGEEILHCYGPHAKHMSKEDRQRALQEQYFFTCSCDACKLATGDEMETCDWSNAYKCFKCSQPLMVKKGHKKVGLCFNQKCKNTQNLAKLSKEKERASNLFKLSQHFMECKHIEECLGILHQCYNIQQTILYQHHKALAESQDCLAKCYAQIGDFKQSGKFLKLSVATVEKQFGSDSIELANELQKLSQVLFNAGEVQDTLSVIDPAINLLTLHYGAKHHDVQELTQMRSCLISL
ncbi:SET and MYND domain-containing protein 4-like isoform X1 [Asterias amurensis]|uniref:SET and MYND domain-containing protein 4-like isoform X1 n=2 Tax=Asterias amurensis TaxID=7602 RepID=UPI003AB1FD54